MRQFVIEVLDTAEQITPGKAFDILTFAFRGEVLTVKEIRPTPLAPDLGWACGKCKTHNADGVLLCGFCDTPRLSG